MIRKVLALLLLLVPAAAQAEWYEARSSHFIVYSDGSRADAQAFAEKLERFDYVLRTLHRVDAFHEERSDNKRYRNKGKNV